MRKAVHYGKGSGITMNSSVVAPAMREPLHFLERIALADGPLAVLAVVQSYLDRWPNERIADLQKVDGGWGPFDRSQRSLCLNTVGHLTYFQDVVHRQCVCLKEAKIQLTPEIMELDEMLSIASRYAEAMRAPRFKARSIGTSKHSALLNLL